MHFIVTYVTAYKNTILCGHPQGQPGKEVTGADCGSSLSPVSREKRGSLIQWM